MTLAKTTLVAGAAVGLLLAASAGAAVIHVPGQPPSGYADLANAVANAVDGDVVQLAGNGGSTYPVQDLNISKNITLEGGWRIDFQTRSPDLYVSVLRDTTLAYERPVIRVVGNAEVVFDGVQIYGGRFGILAEGGADVTVRDCTIRAQRNAAAASAEGSIGTAIRMVGGTLLMERCLITGQRSTYPGGGLGLMNLSSARIVDSVIEDALSSTFFGDASGAGLYARDVGQLELTNTRIEGCATVQRGGGAFVLRSSIVAVNCEFLRGLGSASGGGLHVENCPSAVFEDCTFDANRATLGGGLYCVDTSTLLLSGTRFANQQGFVDGAGLRLERTDFTIRNCEFEHNHKETFPISKAERGGSALVTSSSGDVTSTTFLDERVENKGGAWAQIGGTVSFTDCRFERCDAGMFGGAAQIELGGSIEMTSCLIAGSSARFGGGVSASFTANIDLYHCTLTEGAGRSAGAAAYLDTGSRVRIYDSIACCAVRGDEFYCGQGTLIVDHSDVWNEDAVNARAEYGGLCPDLTNQANNLSENPVLCAGDPDYRITSGSVCEGAASDGTDMGWQPVGCPAPGALGVERASWGRIKSLYRDR